MKPYLCRPRHRFPHQLSDLSPYTEAAQGTSLAWGSVVLEETDIVPSFLPCIIGLFHSIHWKDGLKITSPRRPENRATVQIRIRPRDAPAKVDPAKFAISALKSAIQSNIS